MKKLMAAAVCAAMAFAAEAAYYTDTTGWICSTNKEQEASGNNSWYLETCTGKVSCWEDGVWPEAGKKYLNRTNRMRAPAKPTAEQEAAGVVKFPGDVLAIDNGASFAALLKGHVTHVDDFRWCQGSVSTWSGGIVNIAGGVGVFAGESDSDQFGIAGRVETMNIHSSITSGVARAGLKVYSEDPEKDGYWPFNACFLGDCSKFVGRVRIFQKATLYLGCPTMPADFDVTYSGKPETRGAGHLSTRAANGASVTVNSISVNSAAELIVQSTNTLVTTDLTLKSGSRLIFALSDKDPGCATHLRSENNPTFEGRANVEITMPTPSDANSGKTYVLFEAPEGSFSESSFDIAVSAKNQAGDPVGAVSVVTEDGKSKLVLTCRPAMITLKATDGNSYTVNLNSSFTNAANWESSVALPEKEPIQPGYDYGVILPDGLKDMTLRTPEVSNTKTTLSFPKFLGDSLTLKGSSDGTATLAIRQYELDVPRLVMCNKSYLYFSDKCNVLLKGRIELPDDNASVTMEAYGGKYSWIRNVNSEIDGVSPILVTGRGNSASAAGNLTLSGLNTNFTGRITVTCPIYADKGFPAHEPGYFETLKFADPRNLGSRPSTDWQGIKLERMSMLNPVMTMTLAKASNRGIFISGEGGFLTTNVDFTVETPITYKGIARKEGDGTLALAGKALFIDGKDATAPLAGTNVLNVVGGAVKPLSTNCLDGVKMVFADGTKLVYALNPEADGMKTMGFVNTKEPNDTPIAIADGATMTKVPVEIDVGEGGLAEDTLTLGTFRNETVAAAVLAKLDASQAAKGYDVALSTDGAKVVAAVTRKGLMLIVK